MQGNGSRLGAGLLVLASSGGVRLGPLAVEPPAGVNLVLAVVAVVLLLGPRRVYAHLTRR